MAMVLQATINHVPGKENALIARFHIGAHKRKSSPELPLSHRIQCQVAVDSTAAKGRRSSVRMQLAAKSLRCVWLQFCILGGKNIGEAALGHMDIGRRNKRIHRYIQFLLIRHNDQLVPGLIGAYGRQRCRLRGTHPIQHFSLPVQQRQFHHRNTPFTRIVPFRCPVLVHHTICVA